MKLKCIAIDDELPALDKLRLYINRIPYLEAVATFDNATDALNYLQFHPDIDAVFVDINMPDMNGLDFVDRLGADGPVVVFTTAYPNYAVDSYRAGAVDYLLKPYSFDDFIRASGRIVERTQVESARNISDAITDRSFFVKVDSRWIRLDTSDILYIRGYGDYLRIYTEGRTNPYVTYSTLSAIRAILPPDFLQVHRSYIVNMSNGVSAVERTRIIARSGDEIPIGDSYREAISDYLALRTIGRDNRRR